MATLGFSCINVMRKRVGQADRWKERKKGRRKHKITWVIILQKEEKQLVSEYYILDRVPGIYMVLKETYFLS